MRLVKSKQILAFNCPHHFENRKLKLPLPTLSIHTSFVLKSRMHISNIPITESNFI